MPIEVIQEEEKQELKERVIHVNRVAKVVKGGRRFSFNAIVVVGDESGTLGVGFGKANEAPQAIKKAIEQAQKSLFTVPLKGSTIPHEVVGVAGAGKVMMKPASRGTGIIAGGAVRPIVEAAGIKDILTKSLGSQNALSNVNATLNALKNLQDARKVAELRGKSVEEILGRE